MLLPVSTMLNTISSGISLRNAMSFLRFGLPGIAQPLFEAFLTRWTMSRTFSRISAAMSLN
jgi:hypothetical protein